MQQSNKPTTPSATRGKGRALTYMLAGVAAAGAIWLGVSSGLGAGETGTTAGTQLPIASQTSAPEASGNSAPEASAPDAAPSSAPPSAAPSSAAPPVAKPSADDGASPEPTEGTEPAAPVEEPEATTAVQRFVGTTAALNAVSADAAAATELGTLAEGPALEELKVQGEEMAVNRWTLDGEADIDAVTILDQPSSSEVLQVQACVDSSGVALKDENGALIQAAAEPGTRRSLNLYDLEMRDGAWTVVNHYFPDNADC